MFGDPDVIGVDGSSPLIFDISGDGFFNFVVGENYLVCHFSILVGVDPSALVPRAVVPIALVPIRAVVTVVVMLVVVVVPIVAVFVVRPVVMIGAGGAGDQGYDYCQ
jgi:hypothetical protein